MTLQFKRRGVVLGLCEKAQRQEPRGQRQVRVSKQHLGQQAGLMEACRALPQRFALVLEMAIRGSGAKWTHKPMEPTRLLQRLIARCFGSLALHEAQLRRDSLD